MNALRFLPEIKIFAHSIKIPCSDADLVRLGIALSHNGPARIEQTNSTLGESPSLLLFALHHYFCEHDASPVGPLELAAWFSDFFPSAVAEIGDENDLALADVVLPNFDVDSLDNRQLRKFLVRYAKSFPNIKGAAIKAWIKTIVGKSLAGTDFVSKPIEIQSVFELGGQLRDLRENFDKQLLEEKLQAMKQLAYGASHEINNPLANISTRAQSLLTVEDNPERRRKLAVIYEQAIRAHDMISDMMLFAHPPKLSLEHVDIHDVASRVLQEMRPAIRARNATADLKQYPGVENVWLDPTQFSVALKALVRNSLESIEAREASDGGRVIIRIWPEKDDVLSVSVADNGAGISEHAKRHLFDPFFSGREAGRGLGFGLSKAWRISELHCGELVWDQTYQAGTQFIMRLPAKRKIPFARIDKSRAA